MEPSPGETWRHRRNRWTIEVEAAYPGRRIAVLAEGERRMRITYEALARYFERVEDGGRGGDLADP